MRYVEWGWPRPANPPRPRHPRHPRGGPPCATSSGA